MRNSELSAFIDPFKHLDDLRQSRRSPADYARRMRIDPDAKHPEDHLLAAVLDALRDHVCVLGSEGQIVAVNDAWLHFGLSNGATEPAISVGSNYLAVCEAAALHGSSDPESAEFLRGLRAVLSGERDRFALEYPCHGPQEQHWYVAKVSRVRGGSAPRVVVAHDDVTPLRRARNELEQALRALRESEAHFHALFQTLPMGVVYQDAQGQITDANPEALKLLGLNMDELCGRTSHDPRWSARREDGSPFEGADHPAMLALRTGRAVPETLMQVGLPEQGTRWLSIRAMPVWEGDTVREVFSCFSDVSARMTLMEELRIRASVDALTGLLNRRRWMERLAEEHARLLRQTDRPYTLLAMDLDHFKTVNDQHGHAIGDAVLRHVAERIQNCLRQTDAAGRLGGEEFIVLLPDTDLAAARPLAERLRATLAQSPLPHPNLPLIVTASLGLAQVLPSDTSYEDVMLRADRALYRAKHLGRNRIEVGEADAPGEPRTAPPPPTGAQQA